MKSRSMNALIAPDAVTKAPYVAKCGQNADQVMRFIWRNIA